MSLAILFGFISISFLVSASPGPVMINCMTDAAHYGLKKSCMGMIGACCGNLLLTLLSALGVAILLAQFPALLTWVQRIGGLYLVYLGIQLCRHHQDFASSGQIPQNSSRLFLKGFLIAATNPKGIIYFAAFFPQFISPDQNLYFQYLVLTLIFLSLDLIWMFIYAAAGKKVLDWIKSPAHQQIFNGTCGGLLIIAGIILGFWS